MSMEPAAVASESSGVGSEPPESAQDSPSPAAETESGAIEGAPVIAKRRSVRRAQPAPRHPVPDTFSDDLARGITKVGERRYEIKRSALDLALANLGALPRFLRIAPDMRDGKPAGFRLWAVRADGPFAKLGLRSGDVLVSVNGLDITSPDRVLEAYSKLRAARHLALGLVRGGDEIVQEYLIR